jgi:hypothetical protein
VEHYAAEGKSTDGPQGDHPEARPRGERQAVQPNRPGRAPEGHGLGLATSGPSPDAHGALVTARAREDGSLDIAVAFPAAGGG